jgi:SAM-dependent methyltransferase
MRFTWDSLFSKTPTEREGFTNRRADYAVIKENDSLMKLHLELNRVLVDQTADWQSHDYGEGYFYQGFADVSVSGLRDTSARVAALQMLDRVRGRSVLDIGSNSGFVSIALAETAESVDGVESNPYLNKMGVLVADYLGRSNVKFTDGDFEDFEPGREYGVVMSFANHSTFDGNTKHTLEEYFDKCLRLLESDGIFLFESHAPAYEGEALDTVIRLIDERFSIVEKTVLNTGKRFDDGRTLLVSKPK